MGTTVLTITAGTNISLAAVPTIILLVVVPTTHVGTVVSTRLAGTLIIVLFSQFIIKISRTTTMFERFVSLILKLQCSALCTMLLFHKKS